MNQSEKTCQLLINYCKQYPALNILDLFKFLYQSAFGPEHLISSLDTATEYVLNEYDSLRPQGEPFTEPLDGEYSRVYLSYINAGLSPYTLAKLFFKSAKKEEKGMENLIKKLDLTKQLINQNLLPFSADEFEKSLSDWAKNGYPAIHHSDEFKKAYSPSYRVIANKYLPFLPLFKEIDKALKNGRLTVAIEGACASGKSTLAKMLESLYDCTVFQMDDFFLQPEQRTPERYKEIGGNIDRERFLNEVLLPLSQNKEVVYRKFNCQTMSLGKTIKVNPKPLTIIEGSYSMHPELEKYYDLSVFLKISPQLQKQRILKRNSTQMAELFFEKWIPLEEKYFSKTNAKNRCNLCIEIE